MHYEKEVKDLLGPDAYNKFLDAGGPINHKRGHNMSDSSQHQWGAGAGNLTLLRHLSSVGAQGGTLSYCSQKLQFSGVSVVMPNKRVG